MAALFWSKVVLLGTGAAFACWTYGPEYMVQGTELRQWAGIVAQVSGTMLGFLLAALAVLASIAQTRLVRNLMRTGHFQHLLRRMLWCSTFFLLLTLSGLAAVVSTRQSEALAIAVCAIGTAALVLLLDVGVKFAKVLLALAPEH